MAEAGHVVFESNTTFNSTSTTAVTAYTFAAAAALDTSGTAEYMLLCNALVGATAGGATNNNRRFEIHDNAALITGTDMRLEPFGTTDGQGDHYGMVKRFTKASSGDITFAVYNPDAVNVAAFKANMVLIKLDDLVEGVDYLNATTGSSINVSSYQDGASITLPSGASEKWLVFAFVQWKIDSGAVEHLLKIVDDATSVGEIQLESQDVSERKCMMTSYAISGAASTKTVKLQVDSDGSGDVIRTEIFVLRLGAFKYGDFANGGTATVVAADTFVELETLSGVTATHTGEHCMIGGGVFTGASSSNRREYQLQSETNGGGEVTRAGSSVRQMGGQDGTTDKYPLLLIGNSSFTSADSLHFDVDCGDSVNASNEGVGDGWVAAFSWELAAAAASGEGSMGRGIGRGTFRGIG